MADRMAALHRTFIPDPADRPDLLPPSAWLWDPWEYAATGPNTLHRANPNHPGHTMCGLPYVGLIGTPAWSKVPHCPGCVAAPEPDWPDGFWLLEFAQFREVAGRRVDVVSIRHTDDADPVVWEELAVLPDMRNIVTVAADLGFPVEYGPHYDPRTDTAWARVTAPDWAAQHTLF
ncbi:hypothetical protein [Nocardiopsis ganjiahuensis]|uniref:hypothetical protein n=1 Tax=Nocardiopsis ganjiahuensis TaxID=239984 RepID=UPI00034534BE|nr:hypothetical protein [Nocardiopsis ganjiahuensis]